MLGELELRPSRLPIVYLVLWIAVICKLDMKQHCKWIVHGTDDVGGKGCTRMRPKLHLPVLGTLSESLVSKHS